ncbi:structural maintenance of chromosomes protein 6 [Syngnathus acus]|uniref:structural maintenance of chromosomes protein 6 n=1 Tax=Syngnathus acus TaxID=161584 RepID=UPI001885F5B3|nr:structural maintenance of chromosomes protein 6 [Syngnathus acus]XP_037112817.1 structural maintenance of chromosomes protein 6 [Syngnathus acus]
MSKRKGSPVKSTPHKRLTSVQHEDEDQDQAEDQDQLCTQKQIVAEVASDAGIVESITLKNFMCHSFLGPIDFGSNVNIVVGRNGSGKSAILTALIVSLGGNAQATSRGSSLKSFVKEGESSADVSVTLRNRGKDAYKPELYGASIIIDVRLSHDGVRTYKLKSQNGQTISTKKEELALILDNFNIQVHNPVSVLNQEMSKNFLHSKGEADKYKFFMKSTQLEQMKEDFIHIKATKNMTEDKVAQHGEYLKELRRKYLEKEDRYKSLSSVHEMQTKLEELQKQMAWALVMEIEKELEPLKEKLQANKQSTEKYDEKVNEWKNKVKNAEQKYKLIQEQLEGITQQVQELQPKCTELKAEAQNCDALFKSSEVAVHRCQVSLRDLERDKAHLSSKINDLQLSINRATGSARQARVESMQRINRHLEDLHHQTETLGQQISQYQHACARAKEEHAKIRREHDALKKSTEAHVRNLRAMEGSRSNRLRRFGEHMPALLYAIQDAHKQGFFKHKPRGPLGYLIRLKDPEQALAIEVCLQSLLQAFTCDNYDDEKVLKGLMGRVFGPQSGRRPPIITCKFLPNVHDTRRRAVNHPDYPSVLQTLDIDDPVVTNCLIDQRGIESILLIKNRAEACDVMISRKPPPNCYQAFSKDGDQVFADRCYAAEQTRANYLSGDVEEEIRHQQREVETQKSQASTLQRQMSKLEEEIKQNERLEMEAQAEMKTAIDKATKYRLELSDLQNLEEPQLEDLKPLEEDLQEIVTKMAEENQKCEEARAQRSELKENYQRAEQEYKLHKERINIIVEKADAIKEDLIKVDQEVMKCKHHKKYYDDKRGGHLQSIQELEDTLRNKEQEVQVNVLKATQIWPERLQVKRTAKSLDTEISRLKVKFATQQEQEGDRHEIIREYRDALEKYKNTAQQMKNLNTFIKSLDRVMNQRLKVFGDLRSYLSARCIYYFSVMLSQRGYTGTMNFDHKNETLVISVQTGRGSEGDLVNMRSLSGGERSFSTVCFVLSLWAITDAPFRCLDEFDVYMDMVNRRISMDMMLQVAESQRYRQFIFLTPQSMSSLPETDLINILRLKDPQRGQENQDEQS